MKVRMYADLYPQMEVEKHLSASSSPCGAVSKGWVRIAFELEIPQRILDEMNGVSEESPITSRATIVDKG